MSYRTEITLIWVLVIVLIVLLAYAVYTTVYDAAFDKGIHAGAFAIRVTEVEEDINGYTVVICLDDDCYLHYCYK